MKIENQIQNFEIEVLKDYDKIVLNLKENLKDYKGLEVTEDNKKDMEKTSRELKQQRIIVTNARAKLNKQIKEMAKTELDKLDYIKAILDDVISPIDEQIEFFKEKKRLEKIQKKKEMIQPLIDEYNINIKSINEGLPYFVIDFIKFDEKWANNKDEDVKNIVDSLGIEIINEIKSAQERYALAKDLSKQLKNEYELKAEINFDRLKDDIYKLTYADLKLKIEDIATEQQRIESEVEEATRNEIQAKTEAEKTILQNKEEADKVFKKEKPKTEDLTTWKFSIHTKFQSTIKDINVIKDLIESVLQSEEEFYNIVMRIDKK